MSKVGWLTAKWVRIGGELRGRLVALNDLATMGNTSSFEPEGENVP